MKCDCPCCTKRRSKRKPYPRACKRCGKAFIVYLQGPSQNAAIYCSRECRSSGYQNKAPAKARFRLTLDKKAVATLAILQGKTAEDVTLAWASTRKCVVEVVDQWTVITRRDLKVKGIVAICEEILV